MFSRFVLFPHSLGQLKKGVDKTPKLFKHFFNYNKNIYLTVNDSNCLFRNLNNLYKTNNSFEEPRINIGGDHSMSIATLANSVNRYKDVKVIWVDAHADINTYSSSDSKSYHGMPLSFLTGLDNNKKFNFIKNIVPFENIMYIGIRNLDNYEKMIIYKNKMNVITVDDLRYDYNRSIGRLLHFIDDSKVHLSFDVDVMDPKLIPSTGTPVPYGLLFDETKGMLDNIPKTQIYNVDITELNLYLGSSKDKIQSFENTINLFSNFF